MLNIKHDESYLYLFNNLNGEFGFKEIDSIHFNCYSDPRITREIADYLEDTYRMYQYKQNNVKYGEEDLFYWSNGNNNYFTVRLRDNCNEITKDILNYIESKYKESDLDIRLQYKLAPKWNLIHDYLEKDIDVLKENYDALAQLESILKDRDYRKSFTELEEYKINKISDEYISKFNNKKVLLHNGIKGTVRYIDHRCEYGLFEPRVKNKYIPLSLKKIKNAEIIKNFK